jgi:transposase
VLTVEDWAEIRRLCRAEQMSISEVARVVKYQRLPAGSIVDGVEPRIRELLRAYPTMPATVIAERIGWTRSIRALSGRVAELRPAYLPPDPASRTSYAPGEIARCDLWFPPIALPVGFGQTRKPTHLPVLTMVTGYSRWLSALLIPTRTAADVFAGWWQLIAALGWSGWRSAARRRGRGRFRRPCRR